MERTKAFRALHQNQYIDMGGGRFVKGSDIRFTDDGGVHVSEVLRTPPQGTKAITFDDYMKGAVPSKRKGLGILSDAAARTAAPLFFTENQMPLIRRKAPTLPYNHIDGGSFDFGSLSTGTVQNIPPGVAVGGINDRTGGIIPVGSNQFHLMHTGPTGPISAAQSDAILRFQNEVKDRQTIVGTRRTSDLEKQAQDGGVLPAPAVAPAVEHPHPQAASPSRARRGMTSIYTDEPIGDMQRKYLQGQNFKERYNAAPAGSAARAGLLSEVWRHGGVPVIGGGQARAPVQDFRGVDGVMDATRDMRGIDTGMRLGSPEAERHAESIAAAGGSGVFGADPMAPYRRLAPTRTRGSGGGGLFTKDRIRSNPSREERIHARNVELARIPADAQLQAAQANLESAREERAADREFRRGLFDQERADIDRRRGEDFARKDKEAAEAWKNAQLTPDTIKGPDSFYYTRMPNGTYQKLADAEQRRLAWFDNWKVHFPQAFPASKIAEYQQGKVVPVIDRKTNQPKFISARQWNKNQKKGGEETFVDGEGVTRRRYESLEQFDPLAQSLFLSWVQTNWDRAQEGA